MSTIHVLSRAYESIYAQCIEIYAHSRRDLMCILCTRFAVYLVEIYDD